MDWAPTKSAFASKTIWFNVLAFIVTIATAYGFDMQAMHPYTNWAALATISAINVVLRFVTKQPIAL